jgi:hypothetical protein
MEEPRFIAEEMSESEHEEMRYYRGLDCVSEWRQLCG